MHLCIAQYSHTSFESDPLSESFAASPYYWKPLFEFTATSGKNTAQYRMMLEYTPSLWDALADHTKVTWLAVELENAGLITEDQRKSLETSQVDTTAELVRMVTAKVRHSSKNFTTFLDVLKQDEATFGHVLARMKLQDKGIFMYDCVCILYHTS